MSNIQINILQNQNGYIKIAAMDHRGSLKKLLPEEKLSDFKKLLTESFADSSTAILVDPEYGMAAVESAKELNLAILLSREQTGYEDNPEGRTTQLYEEFNSKKLKELGADAIKVLLYYNANAENKESQLEVIKKVRQETLEQNIPFLVEPITYEIKGQQYNKAEAILQAINDLTDKCDILKLEYPIDVLVDGSNITEAEPILKQIQQNITVPWVLLSRGMKFENYKQALELSKTCGCSGFAVGRAVWQEISNIDNYNGIESFIKTTATDRMQELSAIYG